jgi:hypothetical protein
MKVGAAFTELAKVINGEEFAGPRMPSFTLLFLILTALGVATDFINMSVSAMFPKLTEALHIVDTQAVNHREILFFCLKTV